MRLRALACLCVLALWGPALSKTRTPRGTADRPCDPARPMFDTNITYGSLFPMAEVPCSDPACQARAAALQRALAGVTSVLEVVTIGGSITGHASVDHFQHWPTLLPAHFSAACPGTHLRLRVHNLAWGGADARYGLTALKKYLAEAELEGARARPAPPGLVIIDTYFNDLERPGGVVALMEYLTAARIPFLIVYGAHPDWEPLSRHGHQDTRVAPLRARYRALTEGTPGLDMAVVLRLNPDPLKWWEKIPFKGGRWGAGAHPRKQWHCAQASLLGRQLCQLRGRDPPGLPPPRPSAPPDHPPGTRTVLAETARGGWRLPPRSNLNWTFGEDVPGKPGWLAHARGARLAFDLPPCTLLRLGFLRSYHPAMATAAVRVRPGHATRGALAPELAASPPDAVLDGYHRERTSIFAEVTVAVALSPGGSTLVLVVGPKGGGTPGNTSDTKFKLLSLLAERPA